MAGFSVWLTKDGIRRVRGGEPEMFVPTDVFELLGAWHGTLEEIDPDYTVGDLFALLRGVEGIGKLSPMLGCDVAAFLAEAAEEAPLEDDDDPLHHVEVHNRVCLSRYVEDPANPDQRTRWADDDEAEAHDAVADTFHDLLGEAKPMRIVAILGEDPITGRLRARRIMPGTRNGRWVGPYRLVRACRGWGEWEASDPDFPGVVRLGPAAKEGAFGLELTPVNALRHFPLRYDAAVVFADGRLHGEGVLLEDRITITFGELVHAVFRELGFHGTPAARDAHGDALHRRITALEEALGEEDEPWR
jgi:hypothetical protein